MMDRSQLEDEVRVKLIVLTQEHKETSKGTERTVPSLLNRLRKYADYNGAVNVSALNIQIYIQQFLSRYEGNTIEERLGTAVYSTIFTGNIRELHDLLKTLTNFTSRIREMIYGEGRRLFILCGNCNGTWVYDKESVREYTVYDDPEYVPCLSCQHHMPMYNMKKVRI